MASSVAGVDPAASETRATTACLTQAPPKWRTLLAGASPREVLARLMCGDPLGLRPRIAVVLDEGAYLIEHDLLHLRTVARIARAAPRYRGQPDLDPWLRRHVDEALAELLEELGSGGVASRGEPSAPPDPGDESASGALSGIAELARPLGLDPAAARAACRAFNRLATDERTAFRGLVLEGRSLDELAAATRRNATELARAARRALDQVCAAAARAPVPRPASGSTGAPASPPKNSAAPPAASLAPRSPTKENRR